MPLTLDEMATTKKKPLSLDEMAEFDPEGSGYDYATARAHELRPDETGHWPSRSPQTGQILKGQKHPTYNLTIEGEKQAGYEIRRGDDGRYYSKQKRTLDEMAAKPRGITSRPLTTEEIAEDKALRERNIQMAFIREHPELIRQVQRKEENQLIQEYFASLPQPKSAYVAKQRQSRNTLALTQPDKSYWRKIYLAKAKRAKLKKMQEQGLIPDERRKYKGFWDELGRNTVGGGLNVASGLAGTLASISEGAIWDKDKVEEWAQKLHKKSGKPAFAAAKKGGWKGFVASSIGQAFPYMAASTASVLVTGQPYAAFGVGFAVEGDNAYRDALAAGATEEEAQMNRLIVGTINGAIEQIQVSQIFKFAKAGKGSMRAVAKAAQDRAMKKIAKAGGELTLESLYHAARESLEEILQETTSIAAEARINPDAWNNAKERILRSGLGGGVVGLGFGTAGAIRTRAPGIAETFKAIPTEQQIASEQLFRPEQGEPVTPELLARDRISLFEDKKNIKLSKEQNQKALEFLMGRINQQRKEAPGMRIIMPPDEEIEKILKIGEEASPEAILAVPEAAVAPPVAKVAPEGVKVPTKPAEGRVEPAKLSDKEFPAVYRRYGKLTLKAEKDANRAMTPEERKLWQDGKNWEEFSRKRGYSEQEIEDYRYWLKLNKDPRAEAARGFEDLVPPKPAEAVTERKVEPKGEEVTSDKLKELGGIYRTSEYYKVAQSSPAKTVSKTEKDILDSLPEKLELGPWSGVLIYSPKLKSFSKSEHSAIIKLIKRGDLKLYQETRPVSKEYSSGFTYVLQKTKQVSKRAEPKVEAKPAEKPLPSPAERVKKPLSPKDQKIIKVLRKAADSLQKQIDEKRSPAVAQQNITRRRAGQIASAHSQADYYERQQEALKAIADAIERGELPESLSKVKNRTDVEAILQRHFTLPDIHKTHYNDLIEGTKGAKGSRELKDDLRGMITTENQVVFSTESQVEAVEKLIRIADKRGVNTRWMKDGITEGKRYIRLGIKNKTEHEKAKADLESLLSGKPKVPKTERQIEEKIHALIGVKIPGFFPTPKPTIERMLDKADIQAGMEVLEPSAGKGDIADVIKEQHPDASLKAIEYSPQLAELTKLKGHDVEVGDFLEHTSQYDRIVMNPPFEKGQDIDHVKHAYTLLKPGGRIVSIMSEGSFFRSDKKATGFREWLESVDGTSEKLTDAFKGTQAFRQTGVSGRIVTIDKPTEQIPPRPLVNPKATALQQDKQLRKQQAWDKKYAKPKGKPGFIDVRPLQKTYDAAVKLVEPAKIAERAFGKAPGAIIIKGIHQADVGRIEFNEADIEALDSSLMEFGEKLSKYSNKILKNLMAARGKPADKAAILLKNEALKKLAKEAPELVGVRKMITRIADHNYRYLQSVVGDDIHYVEDYFYGIYKDPGKVERFLDYWKTTKRFTKEKKLPTVADAISYGLELRDYNPVNNLRSEYMAIARLDGMIYMRDELMRTGKGRYIDTKEKAPHDWEKIKENVFKDVRVHPELAVMIRSLLSTNKLRRHWALRGLTHTNNALRTLKFMFSMFHQLNILKQSIADEGYLKFIQPSALRGITRGFKKSDPIFRTPAYKDYIKHGGGHRYSIESRAERMVSNFVESLDKRLGIAFKVGALPIRIPKAYVKWLFQSYIPKVKYSKYLDSVTQFEGKNNRTPTSSEKIEIIKEQQNFYGMMNERLFGRSGTVTSLMRLWYMSPGYFEGNARTILKSILQWGGAGGHKANRSRSNIINSLILSGIIATATTLIMTGKPPKKPETLEDLRDLFKGDSGKLDDQGRKIMIDFLTYDKDYWNILGQTLLGRPDKAAEAAIKRAGGMVASSAQIALDIMNMAAGRALVDWKNDRVVEITDPFARKVLKIAVHEINRIEPISVSVFKQSRKRDQTAVLSALTSLLGYRPTLTEKDKREQQVLHRIYSLKGQQEELYQYLATIRNPRRAVERYNKTVNTILSSPMIPQSMRKQWEPKLVIDLDRYLENRAYYLSQQNRTDREIERAKRILENFGVTPDQAQEYLKRYWQRERKRTVSPLESHRVIGRTRKRKRLAERMGQ